MSGDNIGGKEELESQLGRVCICEPWLSKHNNAVFGSCAKRHTARRCVFGGWRGEVRYLYCTICIGPTFPSNLASASTVRLLSHYVVHERFFRLIQYEYFLL